ncbi:MAG TPA: sigma-70 family RNA polymerase sigma factor [Candidatus Gallacutalibacter pullistercoris]|nr:sigma-70 family RNA polymerase sigma factor [Candidatus Gallacutalibacter pullistercoris]
MIDRQSFISANTGLVHACAHRFQSRGIDYDDLFQAGCIGLIKAADRFDESRGLQFSTYAVPVILGEIKRLFRENSTVKIARSLRELSLRARRESEAFSAREGRAPTVNELAGILQVEPEEAALALEAGMPALSLTSGEDEEESQTDVPTDAPEEAISERLALEQALKSLEEKDQQLIQSRYFGHKTQTETARQLGMTQVQVSRREKKILQFLRTALL